MFADELRQVGRTEVLWRRRRLAYFGGCDYFRLGSDPRVAAAIEEGWREHGLNVAASRMTTGNHPLYGKLEKAAARFFGAEAALLVSNGYLGNLVAAQGLEGIISATLIDERAHASLRDAARFLGAKIREFRHRDAASLDRALRRVRDRGRTAILTDGMFAQDGSIPPLADYRKVAGPEVLLWVDEAHAGGVLGRRGRGSCELEGVLAGRLLRTVTFSKAFGVYGGAVLGSREMTSRIIEKSTIAAGNTPLPLPLAAGVVRALEIVREDASFRERLRAHARLLRETAGEPGGDSTNPIYSLTLEPNEAERLKRRLLRAGIYPCFIRYPGGPEGGAFRFALSSEHTRGQVERLARVIREFRSGC